MDNQRNINDQAMPMPVQKKLVDKVNKNRFLPGNKHRTFQKIEGEWYETSEVTYGNLWKFMEQKKKHLQEQTDLLESKKGSGD